MIQRIFSISALLALAACGSSSSGSQEVAYLRVEFFGEFQDGASCACAGADTFNLADTSYYGVLIIPTTGSPVQDPLEADRVIYPFTADEAWFEFEAADDRFDVRQRTPISFYVRDLPDDCGVMRCYEGVEFLIMTDDHVFSLALTANAANLYPLDDNSVPSLAEMRVFAEPDMVGNPLTKFFGVGMSDWSGWVNNYDQTPPELVSVNVSTLNYLPE